MNKKDLKELLDSVCIMLLSIAVILVCVHNKKQEKVVDYLSNQLAIVQDSTKALYEENSLLQNRIYDLENPPSPQERCYEEGLKIQENWTGLDIPLDKDLQMDLMSACEEFDIPYELACAVIWQETNYQNEMGDSGNAYGYMQIWPQWHQDRMERIGAYDLMTPIDNFRVGCSILHDGYVNTGSYYDALSIYNTGSSGHSWYADEVTSKWEELKNASI